MKYLKALNRQVMLVLRRVVLKLIGLHVDKILSDGFPWFFPLVFFFFIMDQDLGSRREFCASVKFSRIFSCCGLCFEERNASRKPDSDKISFEAQSLHLDTHICPVSFSHDTGGHTPIWSHGKMISDSVWS